MSLGFVFGLFFDLVFIWFGVGFLWGVLLIVS